jgi:hypothetical protein
MNKESKMNKEDLLEQYLAGKSPLHAEHLNIPSEEELDAAEVAFDKMVAECKQPARRIALWAWPISIAAAVAIAVVIAKGSLFSSSSENEVSQSAPYNMEMNRKVAFVSYEETVAEIERSGQQLQLAIAEMQNK